MLKNSAPAVSNATCRAFSVVLAIIAFSILQPHCAFASRSVTLAWDPSPDPTVVGYNVYYGTASGNYGNSTSVGTDSTATISGLTEGRTYYFAVTAFDATGLESIPSNEVSYSVPFPKLSAKIVPSTGGKASITVTSPGGTPTRWTLQSSTDLRTWSPVVKGTNSNVNVSLTISGQGKRFFRLIAD